MAEGGNGNGWGPPGGSGPQGWGPPSGFPPPPGGFGGGFPPPPGGPPPGPPFGRPPAWGPGGFAPIPQGYPPGYTPSSEGFPGSWTPTQAISFAWERMKADPGTVFGALFVGSLVGIGSSFATGFFTGLTENEAGFAVRGITTVFDYIVQAFMSAGMTHFSLKVARGEPYAFGDIFSGGKWFLPVLAMNVLITLGVAFGMLFLIVPGIFLALSWSLSLTAAVDRDLGPIEAMTESFKLTAGHRGSILVLVLLLCGIGLLGLCACGFGLFAALAIGQLAFAWVYVRISGRASSEAPPMMPGF